MLTKRMSWALGSRCDKALFDCMFDPVVAGLATPVLQTSINSFEGKEKPTTLSPSLSTLGEGRGEAFALAIRALKKSDPLPASHGVPGEGVKLSLICSFRRPDHGSLRRAQRISAR